MCAMVKKPILMDLVVMKLQNFYKHHHIDYLGVAYADEGVDLRKMESLHPFWS